MKISLNDRLGLNNIINTLQVLATGPKYIDDFHLEPILTEDITMDDLVSLVNAIYVDSQQPTSNLSTAPTLINNDKLIDIEVIITRVLKSNPNLPYELEDINLRRAYNLLSGISCPTFVDMIGYLVDEYSPDSVSVTNVSEPNLEVMYEELESIKSLLGLMFHRSDWATPLGDFNTLRSVYDKGVAEGVDDVVLGRRLYSVKYPEPTFFKSSDEEALETLKLYKFIQTLMG